MRAITYQRYGAPDVLELTDLPDPKVGPAEVLVRVKAASVNPVDWKIMAGYLDGLMTVHFPVVPGWDVAGVVEKVGLDTPEFAVGDEIVAYARKDVVEAGTFAELVTVPVRTAARRPTSASWEESAGLPLAGLTALQLLTRTGVRSGETVLVHNATGGVGQLLVQLAVDAGARVLGTASASGHDLVRSLGGEPVTYGDGLVEQVRALAPDGVDVVADLVGEVLEQTLTVLAPGGRHASIADGSVAQHGGIYAWVRPNAADLTSLVQLVDAGRLRVPVAATFPLDKAADAFGLSMQGHTRGKIVVTV